MEYRSPLSLGSRVVLRTFIWKDLPTEYKELTAIRNHAACCLLPKKHIFGKKNRSKFNSTMMGIKFKWISIFFVVLSLPSESSIEEKRANTLNWWVGLHQVPSYLWTSAATQSIDSLHPAKRVACHPVNKECHPRVPPSLTCFILCLNALSLLIHLGTSGQALPPVCSLPGFLQPKETLPRITHYAWAAVPFQHLPIPLIIIQI